MVSSTNLRMYRTMARILSALMTVVVSAQAAGCTGGNSPEPKLVNTPPYLCGLIPEEAVAQVQEVSEERLAKAEEVTEKTPAHGAASECWVKLPKPNPYLFRIFTYLGDEAREEVIGFQDPPEFAVKQTAIPAANGHAGAFNEEGWLYWRCSDDDVLLQLDLRTGGSLQTGLEPQIVELLKIAQQRYAELNKCEIKPAPLPKG